MNLIAKWKAFVDKMNAQGIPLPTVRDPKSKEGSITATLVVVSSGLCSITILIMLGTCVAKLKSDFNLTPETTSQIHDAFMSSLEFLGMSLGAYLGRKMQRDDKGGITMDGAGGEDLRK